MNHNPYNLQIGQTVILDAGFSNGGEVVIDDFTSLQMYATVHEESDPQSKWEVMTYRLTPKENGK